MTYEYFCSFCNKEFEIEQSIKDLPLEQCPKCDKKSVKRLISKSNFILQGSCWASDGYKK